MKLPATLLACALYLVLLPSPSVVVAAGVSDGFVRSYGLPAASALAADLEIEPFEHRLSLGTRGLLRDVRWGLRRFFRILGWSVLQWANWARQGAMFGLLVLLWPLLDRRLLQTWREQGFAAFRASMALMLAVYLRLLLDARTPGVGKVLLLFAVVYGAAPTDILPDNRLGVLALVDDCVVIAIAYRCFILLCPDRLVEEHARRAERARARSLRRRVTRRPMITTDTGSAVGR